MSSVSAPDDRRRRGPTAPYKVAVSVLFGVAGFVANLYTFSFLYDRYHVAVVYGLIFPLLIALSWGWKYGLLSALAGGAQSLWWLWGPTNGYVAFLFIPTFTLWIVWHGYWEMRRRSLARRAADDDSVHVPWWMNIYAIEAPFRILTSLNLLFPCRWLAAENPPRFGWTDALTEVPVEFAIFVVVKQIFEAYILLLAADVLLHVRPLRVFMRLEPELEREETGHIVSLFLLLGCLFWVIDSMFSSLVHSDVPFSRSFALDVQVSDLFTRVTLLVAFFIVGVVTSRLVRSQRLGVIELGAAKEEAERRESFLQALVRAIPDPVWLKDPDGRYVLCNPEVERLFGVGERELLGRTDFDFLKPWLAEQIRQHDLAAAELGPEEKFKFTNDYDGARGHRTREIVKTPMLDENGALIGVLGVSHDVTERINLEAQLAQAQRLDSLGRLAGGIAHDLNNMLMVILLNSEMALVELSDAGQATTRGVQAIQSAAERSRSLTAQLLAFARQQTIAPTIVDLNAVVDESLTMISRILGENITITCRFADDLWAINADPAQIDQVLTNLFVNARDAIGGVGEITIETANASCVEPSDVDVPEVAASDAHESTTDPATDVVVLTVTDTGCGMDAETRLHIFEPFYTTKESGVGSGLGLATVYGIVSQNGGHIEVESEPDAGTTFRISFPRAPGEPGGSRRHLRSGARAATPSVPGGDEVLLLVEDEAKVLAVSTETLENLGYRVIAFNDPAAAVDALPTLGPIDALVTDVVMPGMNGRQVAAAVTATHPAIKCLYMSGYTADVLAPHGVLDEGVNLIEKPFTIAGIATQLRDVLDAE